VFWFRDLLLLKSGAWYRGAVRRFSTGQEVPWDDLSNGRDHYSDRSRVRRRRIGGFWEFDTDRVATGGMKNTSLSGLGLFAMNRFGTLRSCALSWRGPSHFKPSRAASQTRMGFVRLQNGGESHHRARWWLLGGCTSGVMAPRYPTGTVDRRVGPYMS
jgi:hypothetical protein